MYNYSEIKPKPPSLKGALRELYRYRELIAVLGRRDVKVRYAQTIVGASWAVVQPLVMLAVFIVVFQKGLQLNTSSMPYPLFALSGIISWNFFSFTLKESASSIIASGEMVKKIYFPRLIIPLSKTIVPLVEFCVGLALLSGLMIWYSAMPGINLLMLPFALVLLALAALGGGLWFSALSIRYRDFQHIVPFIVQTGLYASPVVYPASIIPGRWQFVYHLNPMAGIIGTARFALFEAPLSDYWWLSILSVFALFFSGAWYFFRAERVIADYV